MTEFTREFCMKDPKVLGKIFDVVKKNHKVASHTEKTLLKNKHIKDFCEEARHFVLMEGQPPLCIHYDTASWFKAPNGVRVTIESIGVYQDFMEYEIARLKGIHSTTDSSGGNLN